MRKLLAPLLVAAVLLAGCTDGARPSESGPAGDDVFEGCDEVCAQASDPGTTSPAPGTSQPTSGARAVSETRSAQTSQTLRCPDPCGVEAMRGNLWEPHGALDPRDPEHMVVAFRTTDFRGFTVMVTTDGGATWTRGSVPVGPGAPAGILDESNYLGDVSVAFLPDGTVVVAGLAGNLTEPVEGGPFLNTARSVFAARSSDGGRSFDEASRVMSGEGRWVRTGVGDDMFLQWASQDKPWIAAGADGRLLVSWFAIRGGTDIPVVVQSGTSFDLLSAVSADGGRTWGQPALVEGDMAFGYTHPAILPDGRMAIVHGAAGPQSVYTSTDGASWEKHAAGRSKQASPS